MPSTSPAGQKWIAGLGDWSTWRWQESQPLISNSLMSPKHGNGGRDGVVHNSYHCDSLSLPQRSADCQTYSQNRWVLSGSQMMCMYTPAPCSNWGFPPIDLKLESHQLRLQKSNAKSTHPSDVNKPPSHISRTACFRLSSRMFCTSLPSLVWRTLYIGLYEAPWSLRWDDSEYQNDRCVRYWLGESMNPLRGPSLGPLQSLRWYWFDLSPQASQV